MFPAEISSKATKLRSVMTAKFLHLMRQSIFLTLGALLLSFATGCASTHVENRGQSTTTAVDLKGKNYSLIQPGACGHSYGFRLLGIIPFASPNFASARSDLYASVKEPLTGRAVALANELDDRSTVYLILFSVPKVTITADVIEFTQAENK